MADYLPAFQTEWMTAINVVWPEIILPGTATSSNFFTGIQALRKNIEQMMEDSLPALPYAFLSFGLTSSSPFPADTNGKKTSVTVFYIDSELNSATQGTVSAKLHAFEEYIRTRNNATFSLMDDATVDSSDMNPVNQTLATLSQIRVVGGFVSWPNIYTAALT